MNDNNINDNKQHKGVISSINEVANDLFYLSFDIIDKNFKLKAGQFISILCEGKTLRRPFSVMTYKNGNVGVLIKKKGEGTKQLCSMKAGDFVDFVGAFGNGFNIENKKSLLIGAGVGIAPIFILNAELKSRKIESLLTAGFLNKDNVPNGIKVDKIVTNDGSVGEKGSIIDYAQKYIDEFKPEKIYVCGPWIVLKNVAMIAEQHDIPCEVAMEKEMACSIGVCRGCVIKLKNGKNASVCQQGPVFNSKEIEWND